MKISLYPEKFMVKSTADEVYCRVDVTPSDISDAMVSLMPKDIAKWSMALGMDEYDSDYPDEFIYELSLKVIPELKDVLSRFGAGKDAVEACNLLLKTLKKH